MLGVVPHLENWVRSLASTSTYVESAWRDLSKGRWEAKNYGKSRTRTYLSTKMLFRAYSISLSFAGLGKDATMRPSDDETSLLVPKSVKEKKRKRTSTSEDPEPKKSVAHKPTQNIIPLSVESAQLFREEEEEEEKKEDDSDLVSRVRAKTEG